MKIKEDKIRGIITKLDIILAKMNEDEVIQLETLNEIDEYYKKSAQNLLHYISFRSFDVREIQKHLKNLGLTRFANAEAHIKASVMTIRYLLGLAISPNEQVSFEKHWSIKKGRKLLNRNSRNLLGMGSEKRRVRIMVTQPTESATNFNMVREMVKRGMDCARINCAHDSPEIWSKMISNIRKAATELNRDVKIAMDLAGPKIRTGRIEPGPRVLRFKPKKDSFGRVFEPKQIVLVPESQGKRAPNALPIASGDLGSLVIGQVLTMVDSRSKNRKLKVVDATNGQVTVECKKTIYFEPGLMLSASSNELLEFKVGELPPKENAILLKVGDEIWLKKEGILGQGAEHNEDGGLIRPAMISCQMPEVFDDVKEGERVFFDDGKIAGYITEVQKNQFRVKISMARENGARLKEEKGINFPDSKLSFSGLTAKDKNDLPFITDNADVINFSFVNRVDDVAGLYSELGKLDTDRKIGVFLKIETQTGFENLVPILLEAMKRENMGVMIARGDLAIETGWENIGQVQQEMLAICGAAHVPVVWATQVLENLAKNGLPSRSEITDATTALRAECVMLNKGPYILDAIALLDTILCKMESSHHKNEPMLPKLQSLNHDLP